MSTEQELYTHPSQNLLSAMDPLFITMEEFARWIDMDVESLYSRRTRSPSSLPPTIQLGRRRYFVVSDIRGWLMRQERH